jgi:dihydrofolate synthase/folylpolyglutamate synthase
MLSVLAGITKRMILTKPASERAAEPEMLASELRKYAVHRVSVVPKVADAVSLAMTEAGENNAVCVTGSLYTVGEAKAYFTAHAP